MLSFRHQMTNMKSSLAFQVLSDITTHHEVGDQTPCNALAEGILVFFIFAEEHQ